MNIPPTEIIKCDDIKTDPTNPNRMTDRELAALKLNIQKYGMLIPIITNKDLLIADGEHRLIRAVLENKPTILVQIATDLPAVP